MHKNRFCLLALLLVTAPSRMEAQYCREPPTLQDYLKCEFIAQKNDVGMSDVTRQVEAPAASANSTALADSAASPYLVGASGSPAALASRSYSPNANDFSITTNAYALYTLVTHRDPFGLVAYQDSSKWRRFSVSVDHSNSVDDLKTDLAGNTNTYMGNSLSLGFVT